MKTPHIALIVTRGPLPGKVSAVQKAPAKWGRKEGPPTFIRVPITVDAEDVVWLLACGSYDFSTRTFVDRETGESADFNPGVSRSRTTRHHARKQQWLRDQRARGVSDGNH